MPFTHLGDMPVETFLRDYWQQKPLLIRNAFPDFESPIDGDELAGLALEEDVESRLVLEHGKRPWELRQGPFDEEDFTTLPASHWTLLVQAVDQWVPEVRSLLEHFRFIPDWRLDDIMVSYAPDQGSVGPHFDYYDVFLLQGEGRRRWRIGQHCDSRSPRVEDTALNILRHFDATEDWVLEPGDMLYIPPGVAHWGTAQGGDCITYSIGFRAPSVADILLDLSQELASELSNDRRYRDPLPETADNPGRISDRVLAELRGRIEAHLTPEAIQHWFGRYMTSPKYPDLEPDTPEPPHEKRPEQLERHPASRFAYHRESDSHASFYANGERYHCSLSLAQALCSTWTLDRDTLDARAQSRDDRTLLTHLWATGQLQPTDPPA